MGELTRGERLQIMLTQSELRVVDTWRFKKEAELSQPKA
jgi:hypothetical protein